jgi:hypothetical protein
VLQAAEHSEPSFGYNPRHLSSPSSFDVAASPRGRCSEPFDLEPFELPRSQISRSSPSKRFQ